MITLNQIHNIERERKRITKETYKLLYEQLSRKIKRAVDDRKSYATLQVPTIYIGQPLYNVSKATKFLMRQFTLGGFTVSNYNELEHTFTVSWPKADKKHPTPPVVTENLHSFVNLRKMASKLRK